MNRHPDPQIDAAPDRTSWPASWRTLHSEPSAALLDAALRLGELSARTSAIDDLCSFYGCSVADCVERCTDWGAYFDREWDAAPSPAEFHRTTESSSFSLLWAAYCQLTGYEPPSLMAATQVIGDVGKPAGRHLDFGAGVGVLSQLFMQMGYATTLADISSTMLEFARFRLERRGQNANYIDLNDATIGVGAYDVITAIDVLWLVPDPVETFEMLHAALRPDGILYANINPEPHRAEARWELHRDEMELRRRLHRAGFQPVRRLPHTGTAYRRVPTQGVMSAYRHTRDAVLLSPLRDVYRRVRDRLPTG
jgi:SAM-dependent methyltransferase